LLEKCKNDSEHRCDDVLKEDRLSSPSLEDGLERLEGAGAERLLKEKRGLETTRYFQGVSRSDALKQATLLIQPY